MHSDELEWQYFSSPSPDSESCLQSHRECKSSPVRRLQVPCVAKVGTVGYKWRKLNISLPLWTPEESVLAEGAKEYQQPHP